MYLLIIINNKYYRKTKSIPPNRSALKETINKKKKTNKTLNWIITRMHKSVRERIARCNSIEILIEKKMLNAHNSFCQFVFLGAVLIYSFFSLFLLLFFFAI